MGNNGESSWIWAMPADGEKPQHLKCERCGETADFPDDLKKAPDFISAFVDVHAWCRPNLAVKDQHGNVVFFTRRREIPPPIAQTPEPSISDTVRGDRE